MSAPGTRDDRIESREEEILAELAARLETADVSSTDADLVRRVLAAMDPRSASRRLRLVAGDEPVATEKPRSAFKRRMIVGATAAIAAAAALAVVVLRKPQPIATLPPDRSDRHFVHRSAHAIGDRPRRRRSFRR